MIHLPPTQDVNQRHSRCIQSGSKIDFVNIKLGSSSDSSGHLQYYPTSQCSGSLRGAEPPWRQYRIFRVPQRFLACVAAAANYLSGEVLLPVPDNPNVLNERERKRLLSSSSSSPSYTSKYIPSNKLLVGIGDFLLLLKFAAILPLKRCTQQRIQ